MPNALREDALPVTVKRHGEFFLGNLEVTPDDLASLIKTRLQEGSQRKVYLRMDQPTRYSDVRIVLQEIKRAVCKTSVFSHSTACGTDSTQPSVAKGKRLEAIWLPGVFGTENI